MMARAEGPFRAHTALLAQELALVPALTYMAGVRVH
jgi:hypothetical protein